ncbi:hypothetical protein MTX26_15225 [Bradyrhizobium sp. ISRA443]|uniref:hypothetical protein n=1 Tax=unclassified Bradyrhizobium TaxID=2631580 RepID=UPI0024789F33|nr:MULTISPECIES: hypothetical protein [unclassified Bradyrhizobium]WGR91738.1 hypothetical protein MTX20_25770 [Bradyrhizobium sp. ISRA435]WGS02082.1 hypothetical protein MTX23_15235 [Bradyrhizobium sp. ISRA436]WGS08967.1 hypothetical protein MTX18_15225 [Bradyrhizobium sp. ISRA437]WGS15856.1 hypothetical protein MTX26_15225 [Bradyrhizobium sp. ISRA443]
MNVKLAIVGLAALGGVALTAAPASAMPNGIPNAGQVSNVERVRVVCNPWGRCWSRPNYYGAYAYGGPHPGWRWRHPGWRWGHPGWRWRHPGWRWGY